MRLEKLAFLSLDIKDCKVSSKYGGPLKILGSLFLMIGLAMSAQAQSAGYSRLTGIIYDAQGSVVVGATVIAVGADGKKYDALSGDDGIYTLQLQYNKYNSSRAFKEKRYNIIVEKNGFRRSEMKGFVFIPSQFGEMRLDVGLEIMTFHGASRS